MNILQGDWEINLKTGRLNHDNDDDNEQTKALISVLDWLDLRISPPPAFSCKPVRASLLDDSDTRCCV